MSSPSTYDWLVLQNALPEPWWDLTVDHTAEVEIREAYAERLRVECGPDHRLAGRDFRAVAKCSGCDRALFALDHDEWALVHLTWADPQPGLPTVEAVGSWNDVFVAAVEHARGYG